MFVLWFLVNFHHLLRSLIKHLKFVHYSSLRDLFGNSITTHVQNKNNFQCLAIHEGFAANFFYLSSTKLQEGNVFTSMCLFTGRGWVCLVQGPFQGVGMPCHRSLLGDISGAPPGRHTPGRYNSWDIHSSSADIYFYLENHDYKTQCFQFWQIFNYFHWRDAIP